MTRVAKRLTDNTIKNAKAVTKKENGKEIVLSDGEGLQVRIRKNTEIDDTKTFLYRYRHPQTNKISKLSLGTYPKLTLKKAREITSLYNKEVAEGRDPKDIHKPDLQKNVKEKTLIDVAAMWFELKKLSITSDYADDIWRSLELHVFDSLAKVPIGTINAPDTIKSLKKLVKEEKLETLHRICFRLNEIMNYAVNYGLVTNNPLFGIKKVFPKPVGKHYPSIHAEELSEFMQSLALGSMTIATRWLIEFQLHTLTRASEAVNIRWEYIDYETKLLSIPAEEKKNYRINNPDTHKPHIIPLTPQVFKILERMQSLSHSSPYVFASSFKKNKPMSSQTANAAIKRIGYTDKLVSHGLRTIGSSELKEKGFSHNAVETALSHLVGDKVSRAYEKDVDYIEIRVHLMRWWSQYIEYAKQGITPPEDFLKPIISEKIELIHQQ